ncbi:6370_t:CDS:1, partial [Cetraspora pellucida]
MTLLHLRIHHNSGHDFDNKFALYRYGLWMFNVIKKVKRAREIGKKIQACTIIQCKFIEYYYRPDGLVLQNLLNITNYYGQYEKKCD